MSKRLLVALFAMTASLVLILALGFAALRPPDSSPDPLAGPRPGTATGQDGMQPPAPPGDGPGNGPDHDHRPDDAPDLDILPLREAAGIAYGRFHGRLIAARLKPPKPTERARGVALVHELKLLTPRRNVLLIRLDAHSGAFLEVAGSGLAEARRRNGDEP